MTTKHNRIHLNPFALIEPYKLKDGKISVSLHLEIIGTNEMLWYGTIGSRTLDCLVASSRTIIVGVVRKRQVHHIVLLHGTFYFMWNPLRVSLKFKKISINFSKILF